MKQSTASSANHRSTEALDQQLHQVLDQLSQRLPDPKMCPSGSDQSLTCQQFLQLLRTW